MASAGMLVCAAALVAPARAAQTANIEGPEFPVTEILVIAAVTFVLCLSSSAVAGWKSKLIESSLEASFERMGGCVGNHPVKTCLGALAITLAFCAGFPLKEAELDPAVLWVPSGSVALDHMKYVDSSWSSELFPVFVMGIPESGDNMLTPEHIKALLRDHTAMMDIEVDGDALVDMNKDIADYSTELAGTWTYEARANPVTQELCLRVAAGMPCMTNNILAVFGYDAAAVNTLTTDQMNAQLAAWDAADLWGAVLNGTVVKTFELSTVLGGMTSQNGAYTAQVVRNTYFFNYKEMEAREKSGGQVSKLAPLNGVWEADAVCHLGIEDTNPVTDETCEDPTDVTYTGFFARSISDEFGDAIQGDIAKVGLAYVLIFLYLLAMLGKWDTVWSKFALSVVVLLVVGFATSAAIGLAGGYFGVKENPLINNVWFLILGLGVDDAFVLTSEFKRHTLGSPETSIGERIAMTAKSGGVSILVTSLTDALAFLIGSTTKLPALSAFCIYAGLAVIFCFIYMIIFFLPFLAFDAMRAESNRFDCFCCCKAATKHELGEPKGLCPCVPGCARVQPDEGLSRLMERFGNFVVKSMPGRVLTIGGFLGMFCVGLSGVGQLQKEFKIEWFFPEGSYFYEYVQYNQRYFQTGESFDVYLNGVDFFAERAEMTRLAEYLDAQDYIAPDSVDNWWSDFIAANTGYGSLDEQAFWSAFHDFFLDPANARHKSSFQWRVAACDDGACTSAQMAEGVGHAKIGATLKDIQSGRLRYEVYRTYREDMKELFNDESGMKVFPYSMAFLYWEENGIIDVELIRNMIIAAGTIFIIIAALIPHPRVAVLVGLNICAAILEIIGFSHYWGVTMNGVSTIYFLICVGLSVDYSVHVAHSFVNSPGESDDRAVAALARIGPSVFNAVLSTILAVLVLSGSKSFVFEVFFKILCLVSMIAGGHGLWLLPALLGLLGGSSGRVSEEPDPAKPAVVGKPED
jgi:predicted RND superfamily exporter protein